MATTCPIVQYFLHIDLKSWLSEIYSGFRSCVTFWCFPKF